MSHEHSNLPPSEMTATNATWRPCTTNCPPWAHDHAAHPERTCWCPACTDGETDPYAKVAELEAEIARLQRDLAAVMSDKARMHEGLLAAEAQLAEMRTALTYCLEHGRVHGCHDLVDVARAALASTPDRETV